jgi:hypothetical protein
MLLADSNDVVPEWISDLLFHQPSLRNDLSDDNITLYELEKYDLVSVGIRNNVKYIVLLQILQCFNNTPLKGPHRVLLKKTSVGNHTLDVPSLTYLKKKIYKFSDCLSFERSTFVVLYEQQKLIRLKHIRGNLRIPGFISNRESNVVLTQRTKIQTLNLMRVIYTSFHRDLHGVSKEEIKKQFLNEIQKTITHITTKK